MKRGFKTEGAGGGSLDPEVSSLVRSSCHGLEALEAATVIAGLLSAAALVASLLFLARQTSHSVRQSLVANDLAGVRAMAQGYDIADRVIAYFVDYPELREYFYEGAELPEDSTTRSRALAVAELMADALQSNYWLFEGKVVKSLGSVDPELDIRPNMEDYTEFILTMSPAVRSLVRAHPLQYPYVARKLDTIESATTG